MTKQALGCWLAVGVALAVIPVAVGNALLVGWAVLTIWPWFFAWAPPPFAAVVGARLIVRAFFNEHQEAPKADGIEEALGRFAGLVFAALAGPPLVVGMAWILKHFAGR